MAGLAIRATGLSKRYRLGVPERYATLRDAVARRLAADLARVGAQVGA